MTCPIDRNDDFQELASILAEGWLRLQGSRAKAEAGESLLKPSIPLAIGGKNEPISNQVDISTSRLKKGD
jgi:hypothetical protein